jgi:LysB family phage lysis regulatory protein
MKVYLVIGLVVAALCSALWYSIERNLATSGKLASVSGALDRQEQEHRDTKGRLAEMVVARDRLADRIRRIETVEANLEAQLDAEKAKRAALEEENEAYRNWAGADLPGVVGRLLRESPLYTDHRLPGVRQREATGDAGTPPQPGSSEKERQPAGSD